MATQQFNTNVDVNGEVKGTSLDINGNADISGNTQLGGTLTVGVDDTGHDVKFYAATSGGYMLWDESANRLLLPDATTLGIGTDSDFLINHSGTATTIDNSVGNLLIRQYADDSDIIFQSDDGSGGVTAYLTLDGSAGTIEVAKTINSTAPITSTGQITGAELEGTSLDINGDADISGNISSAAWRGATISYAYLTKRQTFDFKGYSTHDGTNYEIPQAMTDTNAPFEHNTSVGSAGTTAISVSLLLRAGGQVMPYAGTIKKWTGWAAGSGSGAINLALFRYRPDAENSSAQSLVLIDNIALTAAGAQTVAGFGDTSFTDGDIAYGDIIMTGIKGVSGKTTYFTSTMEIEWD